MKWNGSAKFDLYLTRQKTLFSNSMIWGLFVTPQENYGLRRTVSGIFIRFHKVNFDNLGNCPSKPLKNDKKDIRHLQRFKKRINSKMTSYSHLRDISLGNLKIWIDVSFCSWYLIKCRLFMITRCFSSLKTVAPSRRKFFV